MFGKLIGFEFRSSIRMLAIVWAGLLASSILFGLSLRIASSSDSFSLFSGIITTVSTVLFMALFITMIVITVMIIVQRFYKGLLGEEGYLMHTLPVKEWQLIASKGICATVYIVAGCLVGILAILIVTAVTAGTTEFISFSDIRFVFSEYPSTALVTLESIVILILAAVAFVYQVYTSLAVGQLVNKHRILLAVGAFIGINVIKSVIESITVLTLGNSDAFGRKMEILFSSDTPDALLIGGQPYILFIIAVIIIQIAVFHIVTERLLSLKLNLQ